MPMMRGDAAPPSHAAAKLRSALHQSRSQSAMAEAHAHNVRPRLIISMYRAQSQPTITAPSHFFAKQPRPAEARTESLWACRAAACSWSGLRLGLGLGLGLGFGLGFDAS